MDGRDVREKLLATAARVFGETGYRGATTRRIAQEAGVNEVTLFRHFGSKAELIREAVTCAEMERPFAPVPEEPEDPERELTAWARAHLRHLYEVGPLIRTCMAEMELHGDLASGATEHPRQAARHLQGYLARLKELGLADADCDPALGARVLLGVLFSDAMGRDFVPELYATPLEDAAASYVKFFLRAIGASGSTRRAG